MNKKFGAIALTNLQLYNVICFVAGDCEHSKGNTDLYISKTIKNNRRIVSELKRIDLFSNIYIVEEIAYPGNTVLRKIFAALHTINRHSFRRFCEIKIIEYDILMISSASLLDRMFVDYFPHSHIYYFEDGIGSYFDNIQDRTLSNIRKHLSVLLNRDLQVDKLYVNNPSFCKSTMTSAIEQIPQSTNKNLRNEFKKIFFGQSFEQTFRINDVIYLKQPLNGYGAGASQIEKEIIHDCIKHYDNRLIIREHPRTIKELGSFNTRYDRNNYFWELLCVDEISDDSVLIGIDSSAMVTPKILFDKEPTLVFLYEMFNIDQPTKERIQDFVEVIRNNYRNPERVIIAKDISMFL